MIGLFDSGHGGLTIFEALSRRFPQMRFVYLGDHANAPYGDRSSDEIVELTRIGVETLFARNCKLVLLACNTATSVACRTLQQDWLPTSQYSDRNVLGIIAPTVEAATQTPWAVVSPQYPQMYNRDRIAVFGTTRTIATGVFSEEIRKRCPEAEVIELACPRLAGAIEAGLDDNELEKIVAGCVAALDQMLGGAAPDQAILGCTHYPLVERHFEKHLPASTRILSQPDIVADSLEHYLKRHGEYVARKENDEENSLLLTTSLNALPTLAELVNYRSGLEFREV